MIELVVPVIGGGKGVRVVLDKPCTHCPATHTTDSEGDCAAGKGAISGVGRCSNKKLLTSKIGEENSG